MREVLYRGKRTDTGEWVYGFVVDDFISGDLYITHRQSEAHRIIQETVGQYTGLLDKNGVKIFEGDILRYESAFNYDLAEKSKTEDDPDDMINHEWVIGKVVWGGDYGYPAFDLEPNYSECNGLAEFQSENYFYEVIGNCFDNPELLEEVK